MNEWTGITTVENLPVGDHRSIIMFWEDGYTLEASVYDFSKDSPEWINSVMTSGDVPTTTTHMSVCESYPTTFDSVHNNYQ